MHYLIIIIAIFSSVSFAQQKTFYTWINEQGKINTGKCLELDVETKGKKYSNKVKNPFCRPKDTDFLFDFTSGECVQVDSKTSGENYISQVDLQYCRTSKTSYFLGLMGKTYGCFEIDSATQGKNYYKKVSNTKCSSDSSSIELFWKSRDGSSGDCFTKPINGNKMVRVSRKKCKPEKTVFKFVRSGSTKGDCFEQDQKDSLLYSVIVNIDNCRPENTVFVFLPDGDGIGGQCYEIDVATKGDLYIKKVKSNFCK